SKGEPGTVVARSRVTAWADVPVIDAAREGTRACLVRSRSRAKCVVQGNYILLELWTHGAHADVERPVLPEEIVVQSRIRNLSASPVGGIGARSVMARWTSDRSSSERRRELWTVYHGH